MKQTLFEQNGGDYIQQGDYLLPNVKLPYKPEFEIGKHINRNTVHYHKRIILIFLF